MSRFWQQFATGEWLTRERVRIYSLLMGGICVAAMVGWVALSDGLIDRNGKPIGTDFSSFYAAGSLALEGRAGEVYSPAAHYAREQQLFGPDTPYYSWLYPPFFLLVATPLALLPYWLALAVWQAAGFALYLTVIGAILRRARAREAIASLWLPVAAAFPAVFINLGHGQNGFLTAGLLGAALCLLRPQPILSGILFALLAYKPQFALVIPLALLAAGRWRTIASATLTVAALVAAATLAFGPDIWAGFAASTEMSRKLLLEQGDVGFEKLQSAFAAVRMWGGGIALAYGVQGALSAAVIGGTVWAWRVPCDDAVRSALLVLATLLASPHTLDYDLMLLGPAIAFMVRAGISGGFRRYEISLMAAAWLTPLLARSIAGTTAIPLGLSVSIALYGLVLVRALRHRENAISGSGRVAQA
ncbi:glycosyltransferase family 87 protein [Rhodopseudomonas telluris]|uniref:Glycosyltransferase family 87 protein n=1 Tax=Rhodopseudomonas telluris TaxID=644215 RepID=A0ABV6EVL0_9BRAD